MDSGPSYVRTRLSVMMFLEFFIWGAWWVSVGGYVVKTLGFDGGQLTWILSTLPLGGIIAPLFVGYVADRLFSTERVLCFLHVIGGICLCLAAGQTKFSMLMTLTMINGVCFMPTLALANSLAFRNIPDREKFPRIVVWGTIGWIASGLIVGIALGGLERWFFYLAGGAGIVQGLYCLTLPHTPPKGATEGGGDVLGLSAVRLLKDPSFLLFTLAAFLICIPAGYYFASCNAFLVETGRPVPTALMTLCQFAEIVFMFTMPIFIAWLGLNRVLLIGMVAWTARYVLFASLSFPLAIIGLLLHGFCYSFVFVGAYIYVDKRAPSHMRASAQSFIAFLMVGVGLFVGIKLGGYTMDQYPPMVKNISATETGEKVNPEAPLPPWADPDAGKSAWQYFDLSSTIKGWLSGEEAEKKTDLAEQLDTDGDGQITLAELAEISDQGLAFDGLTYSREDLTDLFTRIDGSKKIRTKADLIVALNDEISVTRSDWLTAQSHQWPLIWLWPAGMAAIVCALFWVGSRNTQPEEEDSDDAEHQAEDQPESG